MIKHPLIVIISTFLFANYNQMQAQNSSFISGNFDLTEIIKHVNQDSISSYINKLQGFGSRFNMNNNRFEISEWIFNKFKSFEYEDVAYDDFDSPVRFNLNKFVVDSVFQQRNVICTIPGYSQSNEVFLLIAHYDSYTPENWINFSTAPGADDNASGVACLLEFARIIKETGYQPKKTIVLAALANEELTNYGYSGAEHLADKYKIENTNLKFVGNVDMIGYSNKILSHGIYISSNEESEYLAEYASGIIRNSTNIYTTPFPYWGGDLRAFIDKGYNGVYFEEYVFNPYYHTNFDLLQNINIEYCSDVIRGISALALSISALPDIVRNIHVYKSPESNDQLLFKWDPNGDLDFDHYNIYLSNNGGQSYSKFTSTEPNYILDKLQSTNNAKYAVSSVSQDGSESICIYFDLKIESFPLNVDNEENIQNDFQLYKNYPNPFNPTTNIGFYLPRLAPIKIYIYDVMGNQIRTLIDSYLSEGNYTLVWNGKDDNGALVGQGIYICKLWSGDNIKTQKMLLVK